MRFAVLVLLICHSFAALADDRPVYLYDIPAKTPSYFVYFSEGDYQLDQDARTTIEDIIAGHQTVEGMEVRLVGHADRKGQDFENLVLSQQRIREVQRYLLTLGLDRSQVDAVPRGEYNPLVPTEDGVREAQNRRVEMVVFYP